jgi:antitoxin component YwqK of YwqJK toxin-antitoxin module
MKNHIIISLLFLSVGLSQKEYNTSDLTELDGTWYNNNELIIDGSIFQMFGDEKLVSGKILNGKKEGHWIYYDKYGRVNNIQSYEDGESSELMILHQYHEDGSLKLRMTLRDKIPWGKYNLFYPNGQILCEGTWLGLEMKEVGMKITYNEEGTVIENLDCDKGECD